MYLYSYSPQVRPGPYSQMTEDAKVATKDDPDDPSADDELKEFDEKNLVSAAKEGEERQKTC